MNAVAAPMAIRAALHAGGFTLAANGRGYTRWQWPDMPGDQSPTTMPSIVVPNDQDAPEYGEHLQILREALHEAVHRGDCARAVLGQLFDGASR